MFFETGGGELSGGYLTAFGDPLTFSTENKNNQSLRDNFLFPPSLSPEQAPIEPR